MVASIDLTAQRFGRLTALEPVKRGVKRSWRCVCDCGGETVATTGDLRGGKYVSCGCVREARIATVALTHGLTGTKEYIAWKNMHQRCENPKYTNSKYWHGRGVTVCERWSSFENFLADMGPCPPGLTLDRENNDGNYEPGNCRWATYAQQVANRRRDVLWRTTCPKLSAATPPRQPRSWTASGGLKPA